MAAEIARIDIKTGAIAFSVLAHAMFFLLIFLSLKDNSVLPETAVMSVDLVPAWRDPRGTSPREGRRRANDRVRTAASRQVATPSPPMAEPRVTETAPETGADEGVRRVLRRALGCQHVKLADLSADERARCQEHLATSDDREQGRPTPKLRFDKGGAFDTDDTPYLARKPKNGCKVGAGGKSGAMGREGAAAGVNCASSF